MENIKYFTPRQIYFISKTLFNWISDIDDRLDPMFKSGSVDLIGAALKDTYYETDDIGFIRVSKIKDILPRLIDNVAKIGTADIETIPDTFYRTLPDKTREEIYQYVICCLKDDISLILTTIVKDCVVNGNVTPKVSICVAHV